MRFKSLLKRIIIGLLAVAAIVGGVITIEILGGKPMGLFSGSRPDGLGFNNGQFKPPSWKPNTVSSTVDKSDAKHFIAPIAFGNDAKTAWDRLAKIIKAQSGATIISEQSDYLYAEYKTTAMGFVDDVEFALDNNAKVIHVRSGSRLGVRDFAVNRKRIEAIRTAFGQ